MRVVLIITVLVLWHESTPSEAGVTNRYRRDTDLSNVEALYSRYKQQSRGEATYYGTYPGGGACSLDPLSPLADQPGWIRVAAGRHEFQNSLGCGMCVLITGSGVGKGTHPVTGTLKGVVHDLCGGCKQGDVDLYIDGDGRWDITLEAIDCPTVPGSDGNIMMRFTGSNPWYIKLQARNTKVPVAGIEVLKGEKYSCLKRVGDNYFVGDGLGKVDFPMQVRLTSISGEQRETIINTMKNDDDVRTDIQFTGHKSGGGPSTILCMGQGNKAPYPKEGLEPGAVLPPPSQPSPGNKPSPPEPRPPPSQPKPSPPKAGAGNSDFCKTRKGGVYVDPDYCRAFIICNNKKVHRQFCPQDQMFNPKGMNCDLASRVACGSRSLDYPVIEENDVSYSDAVMNDDMRNYSDTKIDGSGTLDTQEKNRQSGDSKQPQTENQSERKPEDPSQSQDPRKNNTKEDANLVRVSDNKNKPNAGSHLEATKLESSKTNQSETNNTEKMTSRKPGNAQEGSAESDVAKQIQLQNVKPETNRVNDRKPIGMEKVYQPGSSPQTHQEGSPREESVDKDNNVKNKSPNAIQQELQQETKEHQQEHDGYPNLQELQNIHLETKVTQKANHPIEYNAKEGKPITKPSNDRPTIHVDDPLDYNKVLNKSDDQPPRPSVHVTINGDQSIDTTSSTSVSDEASKSRPSFEILVNNDGIKAKLGGHGQDVKQNDQPDAQGDNGELHLQMNGNGFHARLGNSDRQQFMDGQGSQSISGGVHLHVNSNGFHASLGNGKQQQEMDSPSSPDKNDGLQLHFNKDGFHARLGGKNTEQQQQEMDSPSSSDNSDGLQLHFNKDGFHAQLGGKNTEQQQHDMNNPSYREDKSGFQLHLNKNEIHASMADDQGGQHQMDAQLGSGTKGGFHFHLNKDGLHASVGGKNEDHKEQMDWTGDPNSDDGFHLHLNKDGLHASMNSIISSEQHMDQVTQSGNGVVQSQRKFDERNNQQNPNTDSELSIGDSRNQAKSHDNYNQYDSTIEHDDQRNSKLNENERIRQDQTKEIHHDTTSNNYEKFENSESHKAVQDLRLASLQVSQDKNKNTNEIHGNNNDEANAIVQEQTIKNHAEPNNLHSPGLGSVEKIQSTRKPSEALNETPSLERTNTVDESNAAPTIANMNIADNSYEQENIHQHGAAELSGNYDPNNFAQNPGNLFSIQQPSQLAVMQQERNDASSPAAAHVASALINHENDRGESSGVFHHPLEALTAYQNHQQTVKEKSEEKTHSGDTQTNDQGVIIHTKEEKHGDQKEKEHSPNHTGPPQEESKPKSEDLVVVNKEEGITPDERPIQNDQQVSQQEPGKTNVNVEESSLPKQDSKTTDGAIQNSQNIEAPPVETVENTVVEKLPESFPGGMANDQVIRPTFEDQQPRVEEIRPIDQSVNDLQVSDGAMPQPALDVYLPGSRDATTVLRMGNSQNEIARRRDGTEPDRRPIVSVTTKHKGSHDQHILFNKKHKLLHRKHSHHHHHHHHHHHKNHHRE